MCAVLAPWASELWLQLCSSHQVTVPLAEVGAEGWAQPHDCYNWGAIGRAGPTEEDAPLQEQPPWPIQSQKVRSGHQCISFPQGPMPG